MKSLLALLACPAVALASPVSLTHTGRVVDSTGTPISGTHDMTISLWSDATSSDVASRLWTQTTDGMNLADGYYSLTLDGVDGSWFSGSVWVGIALDGGTELTPRQPITQVPHAAMADIATRVPVTTISDTACDEAGAIVLDSEVRLLRFCDGDDWRFVGEISIAEQAGVRRWSDGSVAKSCEAYRRPQLPRVYEGDTGDGRYAIDPDGSGGAFGEVTVYCNQTTHDGGWTLALSAGLDRDLTLSGVSGEFLPLPDSAANPGNGVLRKMSDTMINAVKTASGSQIAYWTTTPGDGTGALGAEIFHRGDCAFQLRQSETALRATTCDEWTITYSDSPSWSPGGYWWMNNATYISAFGHGVAEVLGTQGTCYSDGRGLGIHAGPSWPPFHRGWCSNHAWGQIWVR